MSVPEKSSVLRRIRRISCEKEIRNGDHQSPICPIYVIFPVFCRIIKGNTAQFRCADCAVRIFVRLSENSREYFVYFRGFSGNMTEYDASKMRAMNCAVLPKKKRRVESRRFSGTPEGTRTPTLEAAEPKSAAYTNFATGAYLLLQVLRTDNPSLRGTSPKSCTSADSVMPAASHR